MGMSYGVEWSTLIPWEGGLKTVPQPPSELPHPELSASCTLSRSLAPCPQLWGVSMGQRTVWKKDQPRQIAYQTRSWAGP